VLIWSTLGLLTKLSGEIPPFQLVSMAFVVAFLVGYGYVRLRGGHWVSFLKQPKEVWALGIGGLFGYHFLYFLAFRLAPAVEVNLINYLWPVLIVLFSAMLPGERLRWWHVLGGLVAFGGTLLLLTGGRQLVIEMRYLPGYASAAGAALVWSSYSVLNRRFEHVPTESVGAFCAVTAALALGCHGLFEETVWPAGEQWLAVIGLGLGPVGSAFYAWDYGVKQGDIRALGVMAYAIPLMSTGLLILFGMGQSSWRIWAACFAIVCGALLASREVIWRRKQGE
jgi:drug/metabolite transporter (DMT)-like permease